jgi:hypothetical protein
MAEKLPRYRPLGVSIASMPSIDYMTGAKMKARGFDQTAAALDKISSFAFGVAGKQAAKAGAKAAAADPKAALQASKDELFPTVYGQAAEEAATRILKSQVEVEARQAMGLAALEAEQDKLTPEQAAAKFRSVAEGFGSTIDMLDPVIGAELKQDLSLVGNANYLKYTEGFVKNQKEVAKAKAFEGATQFSRQTEDVARTYARVEPGLFDKRIADESEKFREYLINNNYTPLEASKQVVALQERAHIARVRGAFEQQETRQQRKAFYDAFISDVEAGGGLSRGLDDQTLKSLAGELSSVVKADGDALKDFRTELRSFVADNITDVVSKGYAPEPGLIADVRAKALELQDEGVDVSKMLSGLDAAHRHAAFFRSLNGKSLEELTSMRNQIELSLVEGANPSELLAIKGIENQITALTQKETEIAKQFKPTIDAVKTELNNLGKTLNNHKPLPDGGLDNISKAIDVLEQADRPETDELKNSLIQLRARAELFEKVRKLNPQNLEAAINQYVTMAKRDGVSTFEDETIQFLEKRLADQRAGLKTDPVAWGQSTGQVAPESIFALTSANLSLSERQDGYRKRVESVITFARANNTAPIMLTATEAEGYADQMKRLTTDQKLGMIADLQNGFGRHAQSVFTQIASYNPETMHIASALNNGMQPSIAREAFQGLELMAQKAAPTVAGSAETQKTINNKILPALVGAPKFKAGVLRTAEALYAARIGAIAEPTLENVETIYTESLQDAAGRVQKRDGPYGGLIELNDERLIIPSTVPQGGSFDMQDALERAPRSAFVLANGGMPMGADGVPIGIERLRDYGYLVNAPGQDKAFLRIRFNGYARDVLDENGDAFILDMTAFYNASKEAVENPLPEDFAEETMTEGPSFLERVRVGYPYDVTGDPLYKGDKPYSEYAAEKALGQK